jgi:hypothetical protein
MPSLNPQLVRRILLPASYLVFLTGTLTSAAIFYRTRPFDAKAAVLSDLQSPDDNPHGYAASAAAAAISAILLVPAVSLFYRQLQKAHPTPALIGTVMFAVGIVSAIGIGVLAPFTHGYTPLHIQLASAAFIGICAGAWFHLLAARAAPAVLVFQLAAVMVLMFLCYGPVDFDNNRLLTSLAFWEWILCLDCAVTLWVLAGTIEAKAAVETKVPQQVRAANAD